MKISGLKIRSRLFVHEYLQSAKQKSNAGTTEEEEREADRKKGGDLKETKIRGKRSNKQIKITQNHSLTSGFIL